jgi:hypothetical protein
MDWECCTLRMVRGIMGSLRMGECMVRGQFTRRTSLFMAHGSNSDSNIEDV